MTASGLTKQYCRMAKQVTGGLAGVRERAKAIRVETKIWSAMAAGAEVELAIPASIAYPRGQTIAT
jgi:hypothetical protein